jgi:deoxyadenosine/deoxycytidine kinase
MSIVLSLQGCMGVGKTTAVNYIRNNAPYVNISFEANLDVIEQIKSRELDKNIFEDYIEIQKLWIQNEIVRWEKAQKYNCSIMDFGAEEIEFYTLNYPKAIGVNWDVEDKLQNELENLKKCMPNRILFLDASESVLRSHKENDKIRSRNFFEYYLKYLLPLKKEWFLHKKNVDILNVDKLNENEVGEEVKIWIDNIISNNENVNNTRE